MLAVVDLAAEQRRPCAVLFRLFQQLERVVRRPARSAEDAGDEVRVVADKFLHRRGAVVGDLEEDRAAGARHAGERAGDQVVDEPAEVVRARAAAGVGVEDFEEVAEAFRLRFEAEFLVRLERRRNRNRGRCSA